MHEVREQSVGHALAYERRCDVEVVVVEEDGGVGLSLELGDYRVSEAPVDGDIALAPRMVEAVVDVRRGGETPEVVLDEPEHGVRDHVVVPVVRRRIVGDEAEPVGRTAAGDLLDRLVVRLFGHRPVFVGHRAGDPGDLVVLHEAPERGHEAAASAPGDPLAALAPVVHHGPSVGDDDELAPVRHPADTIERQDPARRSAGTRPARPRRRRSPPAR